ncbi:MAG: hypothetical protein JW910_14495 [Anaerolineae bacterium]|nr:hypothetical protein [Anaerolineae bacterium]
MNMLQRVRQFFTLHHTYENTFLQRQARGIISLNFIVILLAIGLTIVTVMTSSSTPDPDALAALILAPTMVVAALVGVALVQGGRARLAAYLASGVILAAALALVASTGPNAYTALGLGIPIWLSGAILDWRGAALITVLTLAGVAVIAVLYELLWVIPLFVVGLLFIALMQWLFVGQSTETMRQAILSQRRLELVTTLNQQMVTEDSPEALIGVFSRAVSDAFGLQQVQVFLQDSDNPGLLRLRGGAGLEAQRALAQHRSLSTMADSPLARAFRLNKSVHVRADDRASEQVEFMPGTRTQLFVPIQVGAAAIGVIDLQSNSPTSFTDQEANTTLFALAWHLGTALQNREQARRIDLQGLEQQELYAHIQATREEMQQLRQQTSGVVWSRFFRERGANVIGYDIPAAGQDPVPADALPSSFTPFLAGQEPVVEEVEGGHRLAVPIVVRGQVLGAMEFQIMREGELPDRVLDLAATVAERLSITLENARLVEQTQTFAHREQSVGAVMNRLQTAANLEDLLHLAAQEFNHTLGSSRTHIRLQLRDDLEDALQPQPTGPAHAPGTTNGGGAA